MHVRWFVSGFLVMTVLLLMGCTAQQWQTTKEVMVGSALIALVGVGSVPPPVTTRCVTITHGYTVKTACTTY